MEDDNDNKILHDEPGEYSEFKYNFVSTPWDDRTRRSKFGIISLLVAIFAVTMACVTHNLYTHFMLTNSEASDPVEIKCHLVKSDQYNFVARIHSTSTQELLCVGAVVSQTSVIANGICVKAGTIRLRLGSPLHPRCKKGFAVDAIDPIYHEGTVSKHLVLLVTNENLGECAQPIKISRALNSKSPVYIIGRPPRGWRSYSRQSAMLTPVKSSSSFAVRHLNMKSTLCVKNSGKCPVRAGDLLLQDDKLCGLAATSTHVSEQSQVACFADLRLVSQQIEEHDELVDDGFRPYMESSDKNSRESD